MSISFSGRLLIQNHNNFSGTIPTTLNRCVATLGNCKSLSVCRLYCGNCKSLSKLHLNHNNFSGTIPTTLNRCVALTFLNLSSNSFVGFIPPSFSLLKSLQVIDLSCNKLSGHVPTSFSNISSLEVLNLSFNNLEGDFPTDGAFPDSIYITVVGNSKLCGGTPELNLPNCKKPCAAVIIAASTSSVLVGLAILFSIYLLHSRRRGRRKASSPLEVVQLKEPFVKLSYAMLLQATNGFSAVNLIGSGSYGSVYKGILFLYGEVQVVAIKVINNQRQGASKSFATECKALRTIRHRNLLGVITACSSIDFQGNVFQALVYELMSKGNLERWLYSNPEEDSQVSNLSLLQRLNIAIDVAHALDYLHCGNDTPIIHCDLKPTNILLDKDMVAHVGDFGLVKLLPEVSEQLYSSSSIGVRGTVGYVAPEYGLGTPISASGDVYSYGIILLELMMAKKPTDMMFKEGMSLQKLAESALPERVLEIVDLKLGVNDRDDDDDDDRCINLNDTRGSVSKCVFECITLIIMIGVRCSSELPQSRMDTKEVIHELYSQRDRVLLCRRHRCQRIL